MSPDPSGSGLRFPSGSCDESSLDSLLWCVGQPDHGSKVGSAPDGAKSSAPLNDGHHPNTCTTWEWIAEWKQSTLFLGHGFSYLVSFFWGLMLNISLTGHVLQKAVRKARKFIPTFLAELRWIPTFRVAPRTCSHSIASLAHWCQCSSLVSAVNSLVTFTYWEKND